MADRPAVFISYAHKDGMEFVRRLAFALEMYMDVYWDRRLQAGSYPTQLYTQIENRTYFLFVMTPYSLGSEWCQQELAHAQLHKKEIVLARVYAGEGTTDPALTTTYTYGDFTDDFEVGFRKLTSTLLGQPYSSWESLSGAPTSVLLNYLKAGVIPGVIAKQVGEWVIVDKLWGAITQELGAKRAAKLFYSVPLTATGILTQCKALAEQLEKARDTRIGDQIKKVIAIAERCVNDLLPLLDDKHIAAGQIAYDLISQTKTLIETKQTADRDFDKLHLTKTFFEFDAAEKIRASINDYARRSRYLY